MKIPSLDLYAQYKNIKKEVDKTIREVIKDSAYVGGKYIEEFEDKFAGYCGVKHAVSLNSGTDALYLALLALGIGRGDEVITSPFTFFATAEAIIRVGAKPVFVDIDPNNFNINPYLLDKVINKKTKAIIPVHLFGLCANMTAVTQISKKHQLVVIEDACQAIGATHGDRVAGTMGEIGCFSFFPSKNLGAYGDGGMTITNNDDLAEYIRMSRNHGSKVKYYNEFIGISSRLDGIQAGILNIKLKHLNKWNQKRNKIALQYNRLLKDIKMIKIPSTAFPKGTKHVFHQYTIQISNQKRDEVKEYLKKKGIGTMVYYPIPLHLTEALKYLHLKPGSFPIAENLSGKVLSLPIYPEMTTEMIRYIAKSVKEAVNI